MERLLKKRFREHFDRKHRDDPGFSFDDCYPAAQPGVFARLTHALGFGLAATVMLAVGALLFYQGWSGGSPGRPDGDAGANLVAGLRSVLQENTVLALSQAQGDSLVRELEAFAWRGEDGGPTDFEATRLALLESLLQSRTLALDTEQAIAMTGLLSSWQPQRPDADSGWIDDATLSHYVADCSSYCHQADGTGEFDSTRLRNYLLDCLNTREPGNCSVGGWPGGAARQEPNLHAEASI